MVVTSGPGWGRDIWGVWDRQGQNVMFRVDYQEGPTVRGTL